MGDDLGEKPAPAWAARYGSHFELATAFLDASDSEHEAERQRAEAARQRELDDARKQAEAERKRAEEEARTARRLGRLSVALAIVVLLAIAAGLFAWSQSQLAQTSEQKRTLDLFESQLTHASLLARVEDYAAVKTVLQKTRELDDNVPATRRHARNLLARLGDMMGGAAQQVYEGAGAVLANVAVSPDGRLLVATGENGTAVLFDVESGQVQQRLEGHRDTVYGVVFRPQGTWFATAGKDRQIIRWSLPSRDVPAEQLQRWKAPDQVRSLAVSPSGKLLASGGPDNDISLWEAETGKLVRRLEGHRETIAPSGGLAFSPSGKHLASASYDDTARVWEVETGEPLQVLRGRDGDVNGIAFSPDGQHIATSGDRRLILWSA